MFSLYRLCMAYITSLINQLALTSSEYSNILIINDFTAKVALAARFS